MKVVVKGREGREGARRLRYLVVKVVVVKVPVVKVPGTFDT